jgi:ATP-binding cassette subfamily C protein LapB
MRQRLIAQHRHHHCDERRTISYAGVVIVGVGAIAKLELTMGGLIACSILAGRAVAPLAQISQLLSRMTSTRTGLPPVNDLMNMPPEGPGERRPQAAGRQRQDRVPQRQPSAIPAPSEKALDEINSPSSRESMSACSAAVGFGQVDDRAPDPRPVSARGRAGDDRRHRTSPARSRPICAEACAALQEACC